MAGLKASVSLVAEEEEDIYVNMAWAEEREEEESSWEELDDSWLKIEAEEEAEAGIFHVNALTRKEEEEEGERSGWWTLDPTRLEMEEEILYLKGIVSREFGEEKEQLGNSDVGEGCVPSDPPGKKKGGGRSEGSKMKIWRRPKRKRSCVTEDDWEAPRKYAWLCELLTSN